MTALEAGRVIAERYRLIKPIGHGGMSSVYLARDERLGREVAVKVLHPSLATDQSFVERLRREAQSAAALSHPNIASVYDWGDGGGAHYLVMEYVPGSTLKDVILRRGRRPEREALQISREIALALDAAHRHGVVHRDVKPQNVMLDTDGGVKVLDFGIALATGESQLTRTGTVLGSAHYASPEQIQRQPVDRRSDLYSLGAVLYETLAGRPPFLADSPVAIAWQHVHEAPEPVRSSAPGVSAAAESITARALRKDPAQRYQSAAELIADIDAALAGRPLAAAVSAAGGPLPARAETVPIPLPPVPAPAPSHPAPREKPRPALRLVPALMAALLLPLAFFALRPRPAPETAAPVPSATGATVTTATSVPGGVAGAVATEAPLPPTPAPTVAAPLPPTPRPTVVPALLTAPAAPAEAVGAFYAAVAGGRFGDAAAFWSPRMRAEYPPPQFIDQRFAQTHSLSLNAARVVEQTASRAVVAVDLSESIGNPAETRRWVGTWTLVRSGSGWLLDSPSLSPG
ncbi:MAG TPA: protein kinase [Chloroflexota bacterium]|nr:protein kinase [Chloroflexota bacterium]